MPGKLKGFTFAIDFDGTCVEHRYPEIGKDVPGAVEMIRWFQAEGARLILWTMRSGLELAQAVRWFTEKNIILMGANENPTQAMWTTSPKVLADLYIDDSAFGCPTLWDSERQRKMVDWAAVREVFMGSFKDSVTG